MSPAAQTSGRRAKLVVDDDAAIDREPCRLRELGARLDADAHHDDRGAQCRAIVEHDVIAAVIRAGV